MRDLTLAGTRGRARSRRRFRRVERRGWWAVALSPVDPALWAVKFGLLLWAAWRFFLGGGLTFTLNPSPGDAHHVNEFIEYVGLVYGTLIYAAVTSFVSTWLAVVGCAAALTASV